MKRRSATGRRVLPPITPTAPTKPQTLLGAAVKVAVDAAARGELEPCPVCLRYGCDCGEWPEMMFTDPTAITLTH